MELEGSTALICSLVHGRWDPAEFLVVGGQIEGVYDWDEICLSAQEGE